MLRCAVDNRDLMRDFFALSPALAIISLLTRSATNKRKRVGRVFHNEKVLSHSALGETFFLAFPQLALPAHWVGESRA